MREKTCEKLKKFEMFGASFVVSISIFFATMLHSNAMRTKEVEIRYVELAIGILKEKPANQAAEVRDWAIKIVDKFSPIPLSERAKEELKSRQLSIVLSPALLRSESAGQNVLTTGFLGDRKEKQGKGREKGTAVLAH